MNLETCFLKDFDNNDVKRLDTEITTDELNKSWYDRYYSRRLNTSV